MRKESKRYLGLELAGARNNKTALAILEFYPKERKTFLLDIYDKIAGPESLRAPEMGEAGAFCMQTGDAALLELIRELGSNIAHLAVNVPLELPPCITCSRKTCTATRRCTVPAVKWMQTFSQKQHKYKKNLKRWSEFTPYTQRPIELWIRHEIMPKLARSARFEVDETLGGNRAPLTARMHFLKRPLEKYSLLEVWPKLTVGILSSQIGIHHRIISSYRKLEDGAHAREEFLIELARTHKIFIYERDLVKLSQSLTAFDAFSCALTALLFDLGLCSKPPRGFPIASGWVHYPKLPVLDPL